MRPTQRFLPRFLLAMTAILALCPAAWGAQPPNTEKRSPDEKVTFPSFDGQIMLDGFIWRPAGEGPHPALIALHGCGGPFANNGNPAFSNIAGKFKYWGKQLADAGFLVMMVDSYTPRGFGDEPTDPEVCLTPWQQRPPEIDAIITRPFDATAGLNYLRGLSEVRPGRIGLIGWSNGGSAALATIASSSEAPLLANGVNFFSDPTDAERMRLEGFYASVSIYPGCGLQNHFSNGTYSSYTRGLVFGGALDTIAVACPTLVPEAVMNGSDLVLHWYANEDHGYDYEQWDGVAAQDTRTRVLAHFGALIQDAVFVDGFESGDTRYWGGTVP